MNAEIICVGTELLLGNIVNTNATYLSQKLSEIGINVYYQTVVGDNPIRLETNFKTAINRSDVVILTGGLGPTNDDLTKEIVAKSLNLELVEDKESLVHFNMDYDPDQTSWICECLSTNACEHQYCSNCGKKRPF